MDDRLRLTSAQDGIWLAQQVEPDSSRYNIGWYLDLRGGPDPDRFAASVRQAIREAECLHVRFADGDHAEQIAVTPPDWSLPGYDFRDADNPVASAVQWMRTDTAGDPAFSELLDRVRETDLSALDRADVPFADVVREVCGPDSEVSGARVLLVHHEQATLAAVDTGTPVPVPTGNLAADLVLSCYEPRGDGEVHCVLSYAAELFDPSTARELAEGVVALLRAAVAAPESPLSALDKSRRYS